MTNEQREAIDRLKKYIEEDDFYNIYKEIKEDEREGKIGGTHIVFCKAIDIALSLIKEQEIYIKKYNDTTEEMNRDIRKLISEIQKKDKQIDLMARAIDNYDSQLEINTFKDKEHIKQYFGELAEKEN